MHGPALKPGASMRALYGADARGRGTAGMHPAGTHTPGGCAGAVPSRLLQDGPVWHDSGPRTRARRHVSTSPPFFVGRDLFVPKGLIALH